MNKVILSRRDNIKIKRLQGGATMPDRDGTGPRSRSWRKKGKKQGRKLGDCK